MARKKFRIKKKPVAPKKSSYKGRRKTDEIIGAYDGRSVGELIKILEGYDGNDTVEIELDYGYCLYESDTPSARLVIEYVQDANELYDQAVVRYKQKLAEYNKWYRDNKEAVKQELELREAEEKECNLKKATRLEKEAAKLRKNV